MNGAGVFGVFVSGMSLAIAILVITGVIASFPWGVLALFFAVVGLIWIMMGALR